MMSSLSIRKSKKVVRAWMMLFTDLGWYFPFIFPKKYDTSKNWTPSWVPTEIKKSVIDRNELLKLAGYPEYQNVSGYQYWSSTYYSKSDNQILKQDFKTGKVTYDIRAYERVYYCNVRAIRYF